jgi:hypothetical protein
MPHPSRVHAGALAEGVFPVDEQHLVRPAAAGTYQARSLYRRPPGVPLPRATVVIAVLRLLAPRDVRSFARSPLPLGRLGRRMFNPFSMWLEHPLAVPLAALDGSAGRWWRPGASSAAVLADDRLVFCGDIRTPACSWPPGGACGPRAAVAPHPCGPSPRLRRCDGTALAAIQVSLNTVLSRAVTAPTQAQPVLPRVHVDHRASRTFRHHGSGNFAGPSNYWSSRSTRAHVAARRVALLFARARRSGSLLSRRSWRCSSCTPRLACTS